MVLFIVLYKLFLTVKDCAQKLLQLSSMFLWCHLALVWLL